MLNFMDNIQYLKKFASICIPVNLFPNSHIEKYIKIYWEFLKAIQIFFFLL